MSLRLLSLSACLLASSGAALSAAADDLAEKAVALLDERCFKCHSHSAGKNKGGLVMDSLAGLTTGGDAGAALVLVVGVPVIARVLKLEIPHHHH